MLHLDRDLDDSDDSDYSRPPDSKRLAHKRGAGAQNRFKGSLGIFSRWTELRGHTPHPTPRVAAQAVTEQHESSRPKVCFKDAQQPRRHNGVSMEAGVTLLEEAQRFHPVTGRAVRTRDPQQGAQVPFSGVMGRSERKSAPTPE